MKKIKHFRINLRVREIARIVKSTPAADADGLDDLIFRESKRMQKVIRPAAVYETQRKEKLPEEVLMTPPDSWVAASTYIVTVGEAVEKELREARNREDDVLEHVLHSISLEALGQSINFIKRLINEEAKNDDCELTRYCQADGHAAWGTFLGLLPGEKVGVDLTDDGRCRPAYSTAGIIYWIQSKKRKGKARN